MSTESLSTASYSYGSEDPSLATLGQKAPGRTGDSEFVRRAEFMLDAIFAYPKLKSGGARLFKRFESDVEHGVFQEGGEPADRLSVQTEDGTRVDMEKSPKDAERSKFFLKFKYTIAGERVEVTLSPVLKENPKGGVIVTRELRGVVNSFSGSEQTLSNVSLHPKHCDALTGILKSATPIGKSKNPRP